MRALFLEVTNSIKIKVPIPRKGLRLLGFERADAWSPSEKLVGLLG